MAVGYTIGKYGIHYTNITNTIRYNTFPDITKHTLCYRGVSDI